MSCIEMGIYLAWVKNFKATSYETTKAFTEHLDERWKFSLETWKEFVDTSTGDFVDYLSAFRHEWSTSVI